MADYFDSAPSFTNPAYASPEQLANARSYADALTKQSGQDVNRPAGALANALLALTAGLTRNNANQMQSQAAQGNSSDVSALVSQLQNGQKLDPQTLGHLYANPMASPEARALVSKLITPEGVADVAGRPGFASPAQGVQAAPVSPGFQPGFRAPEAAGSVSTTTPFPAPPIGMSPTGPRPVASTPRVWGDQEAQRAGLYPPPGQPAAAPPMPAPVGSRIDALAAKDRELSAQKEFTQGGAQSITGVQKEDIAAAMNAPTIKRIAGTMLDDLKTHGDKMTFGPTAEWSNNVKRAAANYAPGFMKDQLESLASADSFDKMSAQLTSMLAKGGGTDAQLFNNMKSVPGAHNSKEGAEALLKMVNQVADQQQALRQAVGPAKDTQQYEALRNNFFKQNPVINPITGNPIQLDLEKGSTNTGNSGFKVLRVH